MSDAADSDPEDAADEEAPEPEPAGGQILSAYGIASTVLGVLAVAAVVLGYLIWSGHRADVGERAYLTRVMQAAAEWTGVFINMNSGNVDASLQTLHDGTVGELNTDFDAAMAPYRQVVQKLQSKSVGRIESVAVEAVHRDLDTQPGVPRPVVATKLPPFATRVDSVLVIATSVSENVGAKPLTVPWNLRVDVCNVDGKLMISGLGLIR